MHDLQRRVATQSKSNLITAKATEHYGTVSRSQKHKLPSKLFSFPSDLPCYYYFYCWQQISQLQNKFYMQNTKSEQSLCASLLNFQHKVKKLCHHAATTAYFETITLLISLLFFALHGVSTKLTLGLLNRRKCKKSSKIPRYGWINQWWINSLKGVSLK